MWVYQVLDILSTILEGFCLYVISRCLCKEPRFQSAMLKYIPPIAEIILTAILTWFTELGAIKMPIIFIFVIAILRICYKDTIYQSITVVEIWFVVIVFLSESIYFSIGYWLYENNQLVQIDGQTFLKWEILIIALVVRLLVFCAVYWMMRHFIYKVQLKDSIVLTIVFLIAFIISFLANFNVLNSARFVDLIIYISSGVLATIFMIVLRPAPPRAPPRRTPSSTASASPTCARPPSATADRSSSSSRGDLPGQTSPSCPLTLSPPLCLAVGRFFPHFAENPGNSPDFPR